MGSTGDPPVSVGDSPTEMTANSRYSIGCSVFDVECWMFKFFIRHYAALSGFTAFYGWFLCGHTRHLRPAARFISHLIRLISLIRPIHPIRPVSRSAQNNLSRVCRHLLPDDLKLGICLSSRVCGTGALLCSLGLGH